jgi:hypothetical protein
MRERQFVALAADANCQVPRLQEPTGNVPPASEWQ